MNNLFHYFNLFPDIMRLTMMVYIRHSLSGVVKFRTIYISGLMQLILNQRAVGSSPTALTKIFHRTNTLPTV
jgi:hypothetical protein